MDFSRLQLHPLLLQAMKDRGFEKTTPIQEATIPLAIAGKDVIACARTGSGKTLSFLLPIYHHLLGQSAEESSPEPQSQSAKKTKVLVLCPTRELALQIQEEAQQLSQGNSLVSVAIFGGADYEKQKKALSHSPEIIIATPGRLLDYLRSKDADLSALSHVVLDEADRMLDMGFIDDVHTIMRHTPAGRKVYLFSATLDYNAIYSMWEYMSDAEEVLINPELVDHTKISQSVLHLGRDEKLPYLIQHIESIEADPIILFTNTRRYVDTLVENLNYHSVRARGLSGTVNQKKRIEILKEFKEKKFRVLVATDVASRGLHIEDVQLIVNYDIPEYPENYVHRIGRTARAGKSGSVLNLCSEMDYDALEKVESFLKHKVEIFQPDERFLENISFIKIKEFSQSSTERRDKRRPQERRSGAKKFQERQNIGVPKDNRKKRPEPAKNKPLNKTTPQQSQVRKRQVPQTKPAQYKSVLSPTQTQPQGFFARLFSFFNKRKSETPAREISSRTKKILEMEAEDRQKTNHPRRHKTQKKNSSNRTSGRNNRNNKNNKRKKTN